MNFWSSIVRITATVCNEEMKNNLVQVKEEVKTMYHGWMHGKVLDKNTTVKVNTKKKDRKKGSCLKNSDISLDPMYGSLMKEFNELHTYIVEDSLIKFDEDTKYLYSSSKGRETRNCPTQLSFQEIIDLMYQQPHRYVGNWKEVMKRVIRSDDRRLGPNNGEPDRENSAFRLMKPVFEFMENYVRDLENEWDQNNHDTQAFVRRSEKQWIRYMERTRYAGRKKRIMDHYDKVSKVVQFESRAMKRKRIQESSSSTDENGSVVQSKRQRNE